MSYLVKWIVAKDSGTPEMRLVSDYIREGSEGLKLYFLDFMLLSFSRRFLENTIHSHWGHSSVNMGLSPTSL